MTSHNAARRRPGAFLIGSLFALTSMVGLGTAPAQAQIDPGLLPVTGTWTRGDADTVAWVDLATWRLVTSFEGERPFADPEPQPWIPVAGDWDGDGVDSLQMFNIHTWQLIPAEQGSVGDPFCPEPQPWRPVAGDWDGDGIDTVLVFDERDGSLHRPGEGPIAVERYDPQPQPWRPIAGDWDGDRIDTLGTLGNRSGSPALAPLWVAVAGDWDGDGIDSEAALYVPTGQLVEPEETLFTVSRSAALKPPVFEAPNGPGSCYTKVTSKGYSYGKKYYQGGGYIEWCISTWQELTCCPITPTGPYACSSKLKFGVC
ncbi:MAG TPA: hypothetical protein VKM72_10065 [Thermoanaerobaculia bacterium]|nr:hypothetical protein [Thermoanaerobaculia bacterium]